MVDKHLKGSTPDGRELKSELQKDGSKPLYLTGGRKKVSPQLCGRCKEVGHNTCCCPLLVIQNLVQPLSQFAVSSRNCEPSIMHNMHYVPESWPQQLPLSHGKNAASSIDCSTKPSHGSSEHSLSGRVTVAKISLCVAFHQKKKEVFSSNHCGLSRRIGLFGMRGRIALSYNCLQISARVKLVNMAGDELRNLPAGWVQCTEKKEDGTEVKYYMNLGTGTRAHTVDDMIRHVDEESGGSNPKPQSRTTLVRHQFCTRCQKVGHNNFRCPLAVMRSGPVTVAKTKKPTRCENCAVANPTKNPNRREESSIGTQQKLGIIK